MEACYSMKPELFFFFFKKKKGAMASSYFPEQEVRVFPAYLEEGFSEQMVTEVELVVCTETAGIFNSS